MPHAIGRIYAWCCDILHRCPIDATENGNLSDQDGSGLILLTVLEVSAAVDQTKRNDRHDY